MEHRPFRKSIRGKIATWVLAVSLVPIILVGAIAITSLVGLRGQADDIVDTSRDRLANEVVGEQLGNTGASVARELDIFMSERISDAKVWASDPTVVAAAREGAHIAKVAGLTELPIDEIEAQFPDDDTPRQLPVSETAGDYLRQQIEASPHFGEAFFTDEHRFNLAITSQTSDFAQADEDWWTQAWDNGIAVGDVEYDDSAGIWATDIAVTVVDPATGERLGVMKSVLGVSLLQEIADRYAAQIENSSVTVLTADGRILAETSSDHDLDRIMNEEVNLRTGGAASFQSAFDTLDGASAQGFSIGDEVVAGYSKTTGVELYGPVVDGFDGFGWFVVVEQPADVAFQSLASLSTLQDDLSSATTSVTTIIAVVLLLVVIAALFVALRLARSISVPVLRLRDVAETVSTGNLDAQVNVDSDDEIGDLAAALARMVVAVKFLSASDDYDIDIEMEEVTIS